MKNFLNNIDINKIKSVEVLGMPIKVEIVENNYDAGNYYPARQQIIINRDTGKENMLSTFVHEIMEAVNCLLDMNLEHHQICLIERALCDIRIEVDK